jgi:hypothetical protein
MSSKNNEVLGRVKMDTLNTLFQAGYFPHPNDLVKIKEEIETHLAEFYEYTMNEYIKKDYESKSRLYKLFNKCESFSFTFNGIEPVMQLSYMVDILDIKDLPKHFRAIQDLRSVIEVMDTARCSQSSFVLASRYKLKDIEKVASNVQYYLYLDDILSRQLASIKEKVNHYMNK